MSRWPVAGPSEYWLVASSPASKVKKKKQCPHSTTNTHKITTHTRQLQQYTRPTNNNYTKDKLKLATKHKRKIRILKCKASELILGALIEGVGEMEVWLPLLLTWVKDGGEKFVARKNCVRRGIPVTFGTGGWVSAEPVWEKRKKGQSYVYYFRGCKLNRDYVAYLQY